MWCDMSSIKRFLQRWLEIPLVGACVHKYEILEQKQVEHLFRFPPEKLGAFTIPSSDKSTYTQIKTQYILQCIHCGDITEETL